MEIRQLRYFVVLAEEMHFGSAARRIHISSSALSQQIRALEQELGVALFQRNRRGVQITAAGSLLNDGARALIREADRLAEAVKRSAEGSTGSLRLGLARSKLRNPVMNGIVERYRQQNAAVEITTLSSYTTANMEAVLNHELDAAFVNMPIDNPDERLVVTPIDREPLVVALHEGHPLAQKGQVTREDLRHVPLVFWPRHDAPGNWQRTLTAIYGPVLPEVARFEPDDLLLLEAVAEGSGVVPVPESFASWARSEGVVFRPFAPPVPTTILGVCWLVDNPSPALARFRRDVAARAVDGIDGL